jgi:hypothetical protein
VPFAGQAGEPFNADAHRTADGNAPAAGAVVMETMAAGFSFQGQLIRPAVVNTGTPAQFAAAMAALEPQPTSVAEPEAITADEPPAALEPTTPEPVDPHSASEAEELSGEARPAAGQPSLF